MIRALALLFLLAACSGAAIIPDMPDADCRAAAYRDPEVNRLLELRATTTWIKQNSDDQAYNLTRDAYLKCMRAKGAAPPGGVEPRRSGMWF